MFNEDGSFAIDGDELDDVAWVLVMMPGWGFYGIAVPDEDELDDWEVTYH